MMLEKLVNVEKPSDGKIPETTIKHFEVEEVKDDIADKLSNIEGEYFCESPSLAKVVNEPEISVLKGTPDMKSSSFIVDECKTICKSRDEKELESQGDTNTGQEQMICTSDMKNSDDVAEIITLKSSSPTIIDENENQSPGDQSSFQPIQDSESSKSSHPMTNQCYVQVETSLGANEDVCNTTQSFSPNEQNEGEQTRSNMSEHIPQPAYFVLTMEEKLEEDINGTSETSRDANQLSENIPNITSEGPKRETKHINEEEHLDINPQGIDGSAPCQSTEATIGDEKQDEKTVRADHPQEQCILKKNLLIVDTNKEDSVAQSGNKVFLDEESNREHVCEWAIDKKILSELKTNSSHIVPLTTENNSEDKLEQPGQTSEKGSNESPNAKEKAYGAEETSELQSPLPVDEIKFLDSQLVKHDAVESTLEEAIMEDHFATASSLKNHVDELDISPRILKNDVDELNICDSTNNENLQLNGDNELKEKMTIEKKSLEEATEIDSENTFTKLIDDTGTPDNHVLSEKVRDDDLHLGPAEKEIIQEELPSLVTHGISNTTESTNKRYVARDQESIEENRVAKGLEEDLTPDKKLQETLGEKEGEDNDEAPEGQKPAEDFDKLDCGRRESEVKTSAQEVISYEVVSLHHNQDRGVNDSEGPTVKESQAQKANINESIVVDISSSKGETDHPVSQVEHEVAAYESTKDLETIKDSTTKVETKKVVVSENSSTLEESLMNYEMLDITLSEVAREETEALVGYSLEKKEGNKDEHEVLSPLGTFEQDDNVQKDEYIDGGECNQERIKDADQFYGGVVHDKEFKIDQTSIPQSEMVQKNLEEPFHVAPCQSNELMSSQNFETELTVEKQRSCVNLPEVVKEEPKVGIIYGDDYTQEKLTLEEKQDIDTNTTSSKVGETKHEVCKEDQSPINEPKDTSQEEDKNLKSTTFALTDIDKVGKESLLDSKERLVIRAENNQESTSQQHSETFAEEYHGAPNPIETAIDAGEKTFYASSLPNEENEKEKEDEETFENDRSDEASVEKTITEQNSSSSENSKKDVDELEKSEKVLESQTNICHSEASSGKNMTRGNETPEGKTSETEADKVLEEGRNEPKGSIEKCISTDKIRDENCQFDQSKVEAIVELSNTMTNAISETTNMCRVEEIKDQENDEQGIVERFHTDSTMDNMLNKSISEEGDEHESIDELPKELSQQEDDKYTNTRVLSSKVEFLQLDKERGLEDQELAVEKNSDAQNVIISDLLEVDITSAKQQTDVSETENGGLLHESTKDSKINENPFTAVDENKDTSMANSSSRNDLVDHEKPNTSLEMAYEENGVLRDFTPIKEDDNQNTHGALKENIIESKDEQHFVIVTQHEQDIATKDELRDKDERAKEKHEDQAIGTLTGSETEHGGIEDEDVRLEKDRTHVDEHLEVEKSNDISKNIIGQNTCSLDEKERELVEEPQPTRSTEIITPNHGKDALLSKKDLVVVSSEDNDMQPSKEKIDELKCIDAFEVVARNTNEGAHENNEVAISGSETMHKEETRNSFDVLSEKDPVEGGIMPIEFKEDTTSTKKDKKIPGQGDPKDTAETMLFSEDKDIEPVLETEFFEQKDEASVATTESDIKHEESEKDAHLQQDYVGANHFNDSSEKEPIDGTEKILAHGDAKESTKTLFSSEDDDDKFKAKDESETTGCYKEYESKNKKEDQETEAASTSEIMRDEVYIQSSMIEREDPKVHDASIRLESMNHFDETICQDKPNEIAPDKTELNDVSLSTKEMKIVREIPPSEKTEATVASEFKDVELLEKGIIQTSVQHEMHRAETEKNVNTASETTMVLSEAKGTVEELREIKEQPPSSELAEASRSNLTQGSLDQTLFVAEERKSLDQLAEDYNDNKAKSLSMEIIQMEEVVDLSSNKMEKLQTNISIGKEDITQNHPVSITLEQKIESIGNVRASETLLEAERVMHADNARTEESGEEKLESSTSMEPTTKDTTKEVSSREITLTHGADELIAAFSGPSLKHEVEEEKITVSQNSTDNNKDPKIQEEEADEIFQAREEIPKCDNPSSEGTKAEERQEATNEVNKARIMSLTTETNISMPEEEVQKFKEEIKATEKHQEQQIERAEDKEIQDSEGKDVKEKGDKKKVQDTGDEVPLLLEKDLPGFPINKIITSDMKVENSNAMPKEKLQENVDPVIKESEQVSVSQSVEEEHKVQCEEEEITTRDYKEKSESSTSIEPINEALLDLQQLSTKETLENAEDSEPQKSDSSQVPSDTKFSSTKMIITSNSSHDKGVVEEATFFFRRSNSKGQCFR